ncbi:MAG: uroporphyrinogen-III synthase [Actinomycetaceae bacterium]|nr:uroporphyrinogen-III synthase [Actinomycetaceae bacterium]
MADDQRPLLGRTVFLPRPPQDHLTQALEQAGARVLAHPLTTTRLVPAPGEGINHARAALREFEKGAYSWVFVTSMRTVKALAAHAANLPYSEDADTDALREAIAAATEAGTQFAVLGEKTAQLLRELGANVALVAAGKATAEELAQQFLHRDGAPACQYYARAWIPVSQLGRNVLAAELADAGWMVDRTDVYTTIAVEEVARTLRTAWEHGLVEAAIFTAGSNARAASQLLGPAPPTTKIVTFGPPSAKVAGECGYQVNALAQEQTAAGLIAAVRQALESN